MDREQETELWTKCRAGDEDAREALIVAYRPLVFWFAGKMRTSPSLRQDVIQEGMLALIGAVDRFDPARDLRFTTYACYRIRGCMLNMLARTEGRAPVPVGEAFSMPPLFASEQPDYDGLDVAEIIGRLTGREAEVASDIFFEGKEPSEVAEKRGLDVSHVYRLRRVAIVRIRELLGLA
ncbi:MAG: sigma-70 family RNA polymerase sigma factor [Synergistaceae bacterium]|jgi:RNA polymerase sporulation-specific sigma factor|nr:sigma-70 family RNA polymerase sigma factor [Synergistaceae bacterium]